MGAGMLAMVLAAPLAFGGAAPVDRAAPPPGAGRCPSGSLCVWTKPGFGGRMTVFGDREDYGGRCLTSQTLIGSVADRTASAPWRLRLFLFHNPLTRPCDVGGVYAQFEPGRTDAAVPGGPVTGFRIYAEPNTRPGR
jgi:hypothetical protein